MNKSYFSQISKEIWIKKQQVLILKCQNREENQNQNDKQPYCKMCKNLKLLNNSQKMQKNKTQKIRIFKYENQKDKLAFMRVKILEQKRILTNYNDKLTILIIYSIFYYSIKLQIIPQKKFPIKMNRNNKSTQKIFIPNLTILSLNSQKYKGYLNIQKNKQIIKESNKISETLMPSIHYNEAEIIYSQVNKVREKIKKLTLIEKERDQWQLYCKKTEMIEDKQNFEEIELFLLQTIQKLHRNINYLKKQNTNNQNSKVNENSKVNQHISSYSGKASVRKCKFQSNQNLKNDYQTSFLEKRNQIKFKEENSKLILKGKQQQQILNTLNLNNTILSKKLQIYQEKVFTKLDLDQQNNIDIKQKSDQYSNEALNVLRQKNKYQNQAELRKIQLETINRQYTIISNQNKQLKQLIKLFNQEIVLLKQQLKQSVQFRRYKQLWLMLNEQFIQLNKTLVLVKEDKNQYMKKYQQMKQKNKQLIKSIHMKTQLHPDQQQDKHELDYIMRNFQQWLKVFTLPRVHPTLTLNQTTPFSEIVQSPQLPEDDELNYRMLKPNFYVFFEAYESSILSERVFAQFRVLDTSFYLKIRAILDSMHNQFFLYSYKEWIGFPEFVLGFIQKFSINEKTKSIEYRKKEIKCDQKIQFIIDLFNKKSANTWQCEIFRCFMLEEYNLDQIYFYLDCRTELFGGPLLKNGFGSSDPVVYIKLNRVLQLVTRRLAKYDFTILEKIKNIIHQRKKTKNGHQLVDAHFCLKILLEVYGIQKNKSQLIFKESFKTKFSKKISFSDYCQFMNTNFKYLSKCQIHSLYRQLYLLASGKITYKAIHYICTSKGLFIPLMWNNRNSCQIAKPLTEQMNMVSILDQIKKMEADVDGYGLQQLRNCQLSFTQFLTDFSWLKENRHLFYQRLKRQIHKLVNLKMCIEYDASRFSQLNQESIRTVITHILEVINQSREYSKLLDINKQKQNKSYKMITRNMKIIIKQTLRQFKQSKRVSKKQKQQTNLQNVTG